MERHLEFLPPDLGEFADAGKVPHAIPFASSRWRGQHSSRRRGVAYDRPVDSITARQVLRIFRDAPLTVELVERAYSEECWARHPSRYEDAT